MRACVNEFCHEFVRYTRKLDYREENISITSVILSIFFLNTFVFIK